MPTCSRRKNWIPDNHHNHELQGSYGVAADRLPGLLDLGDVMDNKQSQFVVVSTVEGPDALLADVARHRPDVAIVDIRFPPTRTDEGLRAAQLAVLRY
jgi:hypothetical protein